MTSICGFGNTDFTIEDSMYNPICCDSCDRWIESTDANWSDDSDLMYCDECWSQLGGGERNVLV